MKNIVFASNNKKKLEEVRALLGTGWQVLSLKDIAFEQEIEETGTTFRENAALKANFIADHFKRDCFADDSGLEVFALNGEPGVFSARFAGTHGDAKANNLLLLEKMQGAEDRTARFVTVIALRVDKHIHFFEGIICGKIINEFRGDNGFGYDPLFVPDGYSKTFAEMSLEEKNKISHRAIAVNKLVDFLKNVH